MRLHCGFLPNDCCAVTCSQASELDEVYSKHAVIAQGLPVPATKRDAIQQLASGLGFDAAPFLTLLDIREHKAERSQFKVAELAGQYLAAVERVTAAVDRMLDKPEIKGS